MTAKKKAGTKKGGSSAKSPKKKKAPVTAEEVIKKGKDSGKFHLWVNPQGPKFSSVTKHMPKGIMLGGRFTHNFTVIRQEVKGPEGFGVSSKELYDWLLGHTNNKGVPFFVAKKPVVKKTG